MISGIVCNFPLYVAVFCGSLEGLVGSFLYILLFGGLHLSSVIRSEMIFSTRLLGWDGAVLMYTFELFNRIEGCYGIPV